MIMNLILDFTEILDSPTRVEGTDVSKHNYSTNAFDYLESFISYFFGLEHPFWFALEFLQSKQKFLQTLLHLKPFKVNIRCDHII